MATPDKRREGKNTCDSKVININLNLNSHRAPSPRASPRQSCSRSASKTHSDHTRKHEEGKGHSHPHFISNPHHVRHVSPSPYRQASSQSHHHNHTQQNHNNHHHHHSSCNSHHYNSHHNGNLRRGSSHHSQKSCSSTGEGTAQPPPSSGLVQSPKNPGDSSRSVKIKLKPGQYKINVELDSHSNPLRIKLTPQNSEEYQPEVQQEPLYYLDEPERPSRSSLPKRIQQLFRHPTAKRSQQSSSHTHKHSDHLRRNINNSHPSTHIHPHHAYHSHKALHKHSSQHHPHNVSTKSTHKHVPIVNEKSSSDHDEASKASENNRNHSSHDDDGTTSTKAENKRDLVYENLDKFDDIEDFAPKEGDLSFDLESLLVSQSGENDVPSNKTCSIQERGGGQNVQFNLSRKSPKRPFFKGASRQRKAKYRLAERKKTEGNICYRNKEYRDALQIYTEAINLCPECASYYSNRSACHMMLGKYSAALVDAREAVRLDPEFVKGYIRVAKCNISLGDAVAALSVLRRADEIEPNNKSIEDESNSAQQLIRCQEEANKFAAKNDFRSAVYHLDRAIELAVGCNQLKILKAEYLSYLQRYGDAQEIVNEIIQFDNSNVDAIFVRGLCLYYQDNCDQAFNHFQHVLRLAPDHKKAKESYKKAKLLRQKKEEGNLAFNKGQLVEALSLYSEALDIDPNNRNTRSKLYFNRATVKAKLRKLDEAVEDCTSAINLDESYLKAFLRRAKCYQELEKHDEAVRDYEKVFKLDKNPENKRLLQDAKIQQKRAKRKDYYKILGVGKSATDDEIKKSYRKMALQFHPDRHASASEQEKRASEVKFKEVGEAYTVLTDAKKRAMYDRGQDINDPDAGFFHEDVDPNQLFQTIFSNGPFGGGFGGHPGFGGGGGFQGAGFSGGNFPGGFHFQFG